MTKSRKTLMGVLIGIILIIGVIGMSVDFITDWLWFSEMGYVSVFFTKLFTQLKIGIPLFLIATILTNVYLRGLKKKYFAKIKSHEATDMKKLNLITNVFSLVFGAVISLVTIQKMWFEILQFANASDFNIKDPLFNLDISFYIFRLDFLKELNDLLLSLIFFFVVITIVYYLILLSMHSPDILEHEETEEGEGQTEYSDGETFTGTKKKGLEGFFEDLVQKGNSRHRGGLQKKQLDRSNIDSLISIASGHLAILGVLFFLMLEANFILSQLAMVQNHTGAVYGAGFTDVKLTLWVYRIEMVLGGVAIGVFLAALKTRKFKRIITVAAIMVVVAIAGAGGRILVQDFIVSPDEINKEAPYLKNNIKYTKLAYDIKDVDVKPFGATDNLTGSDIAANEDIISNVRINDYEPVQTFYNQTQSIRQYYTFNDVDVDRYNINGKYTQSYLSVREIDESKINDTWINRHIKYTHGYGLALSKVNSVTPSGQPSVLIKNIPPESQVEEIKIDRPEIYFGELSNDYILVNTNEDEFDYPDGNSNKYTRYQGDGGIKLNWFNRVMFSIKEQSLKLLVSTNINSDSKIIIHRNIMDRVKHIMPYLTYEDDPYAVIVDGKIYWMIDAYTTSKEYPYSEPYNGKVGSTNYIRNSVKVVVDAYNGDVNFYVVDKDDPIAQTYQKIYPKLFKPVEKMPAELQKHMRYPSTLFEMQANVYKRYHMDDVKVFYQNEDLWDVASQIYGTEEKAMKSNYYIVSLPGEEGTEFINSIPFTPKSKQNMTALMVARNDGEHYGQLVVYQMPKSKTVYGPMQIEAQIDQNTQISQDFSLWNSSGSKYSRGTLFVVPVEDSLLYVEPVYLEASNSAIPEVKRVIVAYKDKIAYEPTLGEALESLFGEGNTGGSDTVSNEGAEETAGSDKKPSMSEVIKSANDAYKAGQDALKSGDFAEYGKQMELVEKYLGELSKMNS